MTDNMNFLDAELKTLKDEGRFITPRVLQSTQSPVATIDGKEVINLTSNNYLCLTTHPKVKQASIDATEKYGIGAAAVRSIIGTTNLHEELEKRLAEFKQTEACLVVQSGFSANVTVCQSLMTSPEDVLISDELNHASIIDGGRLSKAKKKIYRHCDMNYLEEILKSDEVQNARRKMVVTDGVFSMDGDIAPLPKIVELCEKYKVVLMVDDAHSSGVLGADGRGTVAHFDLKGRVDIQIGTLSKAFATVGGYVACTQKLRDYLGSVSRPFLFSSAAPQSVIATCLAGLDVLYNEPEHLKTLWDNTKFFKTELKKAGFDTGDSETPITPIIVGDGDKATEFSKRLFEEGVFALAIKFPTVPKGKERLRTIITSGHTKENLQKAVETFKKVGKELEII